MGYKRAKTTVKPDSPFIAPGFVALRTPLLPLDDMIAWGANLDAPHAIQTSTHLESALEVDRRALRARLAAAVSRPEIREALFVASPTTDASFDEWLRAPDGEHGQKVERTLVRYFSRMTSRSTPFGLFSGCSVCAMGSGTRLVLEALGGYQRHTRLDMDYLCKLTEALGQQPAMAAGLRYRPSSSLYMAAGRWRYAEGRFEANQRRYDLVAVDRTEYLDATLTRAGSAPNGVTTAELVQALVGMDAEITHEEAQAYIAELVATQLLVPELAPAVTGEEPIHGLIAQLREHAPSADAARRLEQTRDELARLDGDGLGASSRRYLDIARDLENLPCAVELPRLFQVDMVKPAPEARLGAEVVDELRSTVAMLHRIAPTFGPSALDKFRDAFVARFEDREVPLLVALDDEAGVGYGPAEEVSPLLEGIVFDATAATSRTFEQRHFVLLERWQQALQRGDREIVLGDGDLKRLENASPPPLPSSFSIMATLGARSPEALAAGDYRIYFEGMSSGLSLLGRFCHADPQLHAWVAKQMRDEQALVPDAVLAEIVHLPEGRIGNVICRPVLRDYEIPILGRSGAPQDKQIAVDDLMVSIGPGRQIVLRSKRLGKRVLPRLTNAHNYSARSIGIYRFLCELGREGTPFLGLDWGPLANAGYRPRVRIGKIVLSLETWRIGKRELEPLGRVKGAARYQAVQELRAKHRMPRFVTVVDHDNVLPVDLDNVLAVESFVHLVKGRSEVLLEELAPGPDELCVEGPEGRFCHELVVPFIRAENPPARTAGPSNGDAVRTTGNAVRAFPPGSEWLYAKLYTGNATADHVLLAMRPVIEGVLASGAADSWFFIRYGDPDWHIRLRFHGAPARLAAEVLPALHEAAAPLLADGRMWKLQLDTYVRELERYGGDEGIVLAERWFDIDSRTALAIVELLDGNAGLDARWRLAFRGIDQLLDDLGFDLETKRRMIRSARDAFAAEHEVGVATTRALGDKYRKERTALEALLDRSGDAEHALAPGLAQIVEASPRVRDVGDALRAAERAGRLRLPIERLAGSYVHMLANRLLRSAARKQELVLYDLLDRCYTSRVARARKAASES